MDRRDWPSLALGDWEPTYLTLHRFTQVVGKVQLALTPPVNHWWHVTERVTARGLTTGTPCGERHLMMTFDFVEHRFTAETSERGAQSFALEPMSVADFYERVLAALGRLEIDVRLWPVPVEVKDTTPFPSDRNHAAYDAAAVERLHRALLSISRVFSIHRGRFLGKSSPVHFFWGAFDLAVSRFNGQRAPLRKAPIDRDAYDEEVISLGFWPGDPWTGKTDAMFYSYTVPEPAGLSRQKVSPSAAFFSEELKEFLLPYDEVRRAPDPAKLILEFAESTYDAGSKLAGWDRAALGYP
jgi:hypothetical protein